MPTRRVLIAAISLVALVTFAGCKKPQLVPAPHLYITGNLEPFADVPETFRSNTVDLLYATDRQPEEGKHGEIEYGYERFRSLAVGSCIVEFGKDVLWDTLVEASQTGKRKVKLPLAVRSITEHFRFPRTPAPLEKEGGVIVDLPEWEAAKQRATEKLHEEVRRRLAMTPRKEAFIFVHGYNNTFDVAAFRTAEIWHYLGREGVPICYSWPSGAPGFLRGYNHDTESGEFTNFHLKTFLEDLAACPELEAINIIAHSRGTDVVSTALKELILVTRARGDDPRSTLKLRTVILAATDMSVDVFSQRFGAEDMFRDFESFTFYVSRKDHAIGTARWLFADNKRMGDIRPEQLTETQKERLGTVGNVAIVDSRVKTGFIGHGYFLSSPATFSDVLLVLRYGRPPGAEHGRPLTEVIPRFYILDDDYPWEAAPMPRMKTPATQ